MVKDRVQIELNRQKEIYLMVNAAADGAQFIQMQGKLSVYDEFIFQHRHFFLKMPHLWSL